MAWCAALKVVLGVTALLAPAPASFFSTFTRPLAFTPALGAGEAVVDEATGEGGRVEEEVGEGGRGGRPLRTGRRWETWVHAPPLAGVDPAVGLALACTGVAVEGVVEALGVGTVDEGGVGVAWEWFKAAGHLKGAPEKIQVFEAGSYTRQDERLPDTLPSTSPLGTPPFPAGAEESMKGGGSTALLFFKSLLACCISLDSGSGRVGRGGELAGAVEGVEKGVEDVVAENEKPVVPVTGPPLLTLLDRVDLVVPPNPAAAAKVIRPKEELFRE